jgi:hypothetical protein
MSEICESSFIPWITACDLWSGLTIEFVGMVIELLIIFGGLEVIRRVREYKKYKSVRESTRQMFSKYARALVDEIEAGTTLLMELKAAGHDATDARNAGNPFQRVQELYTNISRDLFDRYPLLDKETIQVGELVIHDIEELMSVWCVARMIDAGGEQNWKAITKEAFFKSVSNDMGKIERSSSRIKGLGTMLDSIRFRGLSFSEATKLISADLK